MNYANSFKFFKYCLLTLILVIVSQKAMAQDYGDKEFYLIDSLDLDKLSSVDKELLDTSLAKYHKATHDTIKYAILENIIDNCWNNKVWPKYNHYLISKIKTRLTVNLSSTERDKVIYFLAGALSNLGFYQDERGDYISAVNYYHESRRLYESIDNKVGISTVNNNLGVIYSLIGDTTLALSFHKKSLMIKMELKDSVGISLSYANIGSIYENADEPFIALEYYKSSLKLAKKIKSGRVLALSYDSVGDIYLSEGYPHKALTYFNKAYEIWVKMDMDVGISSSLNNLANAHLAIGEAEIAKQYALESFKIAEKLEYPVDIRNASNTLATIYNKENNYKEALFYQNWQIRMMVIVDNYENAEMAFKKSMQYAHQKETLHDSLEFQKERELQQSRMREKETQAYALYGGIALMLVVLLLGVKSFRQKKKDNKLILLQKKEVESQKKEIENQHLILEKSHTDISDSIRYAQQIQQAILPTSTLLNSFLKNCFVLYKPKDVVSGDFYWAVKVGENIIFAAADCTGHGVPGAMVSVVCHNALNRAVREFHLLEPAAILNKTREFVIEAFSDNELEVKDGMDISICCWDTITNELQWAGANNPLYIIRQDNTEELEIYPADKQPVGLFHADTPFTNNIIQLNEGDLFYLFTDGFQDQFGGENGKKYKTGPYRRFIISLANKEIQSQRGILEKEFESWKGEYEQIDDVCIIGVKVKSL